MEIIKAVLLMLVLGGVIGVFAYAVFSSEKEGKVE